MRIIFKPFKLKQFDNASEGQAYWRATTDFPCTKSGKPMFGKGIDKMSALADLCSFLPAKMQQSVRKLTEENMFPMPDQEGFRFWQVNLDGSKPDKEKWLYERQYYNTFGHLPYYD
jgi:hypothetical protein